jgi:hypothetical protein
MNPTDITASPRLRAAFFIVAAVMLALWGWSLVPAIQSWNNPNEDGFSFVPVFYATIIALPLGLVLLVGGISGHGKKVKRAQSALVIAFAVLGLIVAFLIFARINNGPGG